MLKLLLIAPDRFKTWWELYGTGCTRRRYVAAVTRPATGRFVWYGCGQYCNSGSCPNGNSPFACFFKFEKDGTLTTLSSYGVHDVKGTVPCLYNPQYDAKYRSPCAAIDDRYRKCMLGYTANQSYAVLSQAYYKCTALNAPCKTTACPYKQRIY